MGDPRQPSLDLLSAVLGGQSGRLFLRLREQEGLVYHAGASSTEGVDAGHVVVYAATGHDKLGRTREAIARELELVRRELVREDEFERARAWMIGQHEQGLQRRSRLSAHLAFAEAYGLGMRYYLDAPERLRAVRREDLLAVAQELLDERAAVTVLVGQADST